MVFHALADLVVAIHFGFVIFVIAGALLLFRWPRLAWLHVPAVLWAALIEFAGWVCPLTDLEVWLRQHSGMATYRGDFLQQYLIPVLYPAHLTPAIQVILGILVVVVNGIIYTVLVRRRHR